MKKKPTLRSLKAKCWKVFSEYIRRKDADEGGTTRCYTCCRAIHWKYEAQAGHAIPGRHNAVLFDPDIVKPQCQRCNVWAGGQYHIFATNLIKEHGMDWWEQKLAGAREIVKVGRDDLEKLIESYRQKLNALPA